MRLLYALESARPDGGGLEVELRHWASEMARTGAQVTVAVSSGGEHPPAGRGLPEEVEVLEIPRLPLGRIAARFGLTSGLHRRIRTRPPDVVHVYSCLPSYFPFSAMRAARSLGASLVWTPMFHPIRRRLWPALHPMRVFDRVAPLTARNVDAVVAATEAEAREFRDLGCPRVELIPPAVSAEPPVPMHEAEGFRARLGIHDAPLVLVVSARDEKRKGLPFAAAAFEALGSPTAVLARVGGGRTGRQGRVLHLGRVSDRDLARSLRAADVVLVPSAYEAFSRVVIEAWQQETPVVVTDRVGLAPVVAEGGGLVTPYGDVATAAEALAALLRNRQAGRSLGRRGFQIVQERFLLADVAKKAATMYEGLVSGELAGPGKNVRARVRAVAHRPSAATRANS